jgi:hypothetical protein
MSQATYEDVNLILKLYELRREDKMREARAWFLADCKPKNAQGLMELCPPGSDNNARFRMVVSYWDMVGSFVTAGVLNEELLAQSTNELLLTWERVRPLVAELRAFLQGSGRVAASRNRRQLARRAHEEARRLRRIYRTGRRFIRSLMKCEPDHFGEEELALIYVAKKLKEALRLEQLLTESGIDYLVEPDKFVGGVMFKSERIGAFFLRRAREYRRGAEV